MKKSTLFLACCIGLMLLASCKKDPVAPTISVFNGTGYATENTQIFSGDEIKIGFVATGEKLTKLEVTISQNGAVLTSHFATIENAENYTYSHTFTIESTGTVTITGTVTDAANQTASTSFNIIYNEKPNARFVGHYEGNALATGFIEAQISGMGMEPEPVQEEFTDREVPVILDITAGSDMNDVYATCIIDERTMTATGTVEGDKITFESFNDVVTFDYDLGFMVIHPQINVSYTVVATLDGNQLMLDGNSTGEGEINALIYNGTLNMEATIGGSLNKMR